VRAVARPACLPLMKVGWEIALRARAVRGVPMQVRAVRTRESGRA